MADDTKTQVENAAKQAATDIGSGVSGWISAHPKAAWTILCVVCVLVVGIWIGMRMHAS